MNTIKVKGVELGVLIDALKDTPGVDRRRIAIGETHLQQGLMALTRAVAQPTFF